jgi:hypothetical protein
MTDTVTLPATQTVYMDYCYEKQLGTFQRALDEHMSRSAKMSAINDMVTYVSPSMYKKLLTMLGDK